MAVLRCQALRMWVGDSSAIGSGASAARPPPVARSEQCLAGAFPDRGVRRVEVVDAGVIDLGGVVVEIALDR